MLRVLYLSFAIISFLSGATVMANSTLECYTIDPEGPEDPVGTLPNIPTTDSQQQLWNLCNSTFPKCENHCATRFK